MSASAAQLQFAAEFVLFVAAASGVAAVALASTVLRHGLAGRGGRGGIAVGLLLLAAASFLHGSQLVAEADAPAIVVLRACGVVVAALGSLAWAAGVVPAMLLRASLGLVAISIGVDLAGAHNVSSGLLAVAGLVLGGSVLTASRRSIAAQVAASAAVTLLIVVVVLGVALSAVLVSTVEEGAADRLERRVGNEATTASNSFTARIDDATLVAASLKGQRLAELRRFAGAGAPSATLSEPLSVLSANFLANAGLAYVARSETVQGVAAGSVGLDSATVLGLARSEVVRQAIRRGAARGSVTVLGGKVLVVGAQPVRDNDPSRAVLGVAVAVSELDATSLAVAGADDPDLSLALARRGAIIARRGPQPPLEPLRSLVGAALDEGERRSAIIGGRFVAVAPVLAADGRPVVAVVASTPTTLVNETRDSVFRNLFLIALGGTFLALLFATVVGNRIGSRLRQLTGAVRAMEQGDLSVRTGTGRRGDANGAGDGEGGEDEVGVLGRSFDAMATSVEEKTIAESALRERLEAVVGGMGEALLAVDGGGVVTDFNQAAEYLLGVTATEARGRLLREVGTFRADDGSDLVLPPLAAPAPWRSQGWVVRRDGHEVPVAVTAGAVRGPGARAGGTVFVLRDLRPEREIEQMKTEFLSRIGHELRTPLTGIIGYADLLNRKRVPADRAVAWQGEILTQSKGLLRIVEMLEFFASAGAGRMSLRLEEVDPRPLLDEVVRTWRRRLGRPRALRRRLTPNLPHVQADRRLLSSCLDELIDNARKFSPPNASIEVAATVVTAAGGGGTSAGMGRGMGTTGRGTSVELSVTDRGTGMTDEEKARALAVFGQGDASDTRNHGGLGLGLSFVQRVVEAHGGRLSFESSREKGSKFSILLPSVPMRDAE
ncbi:MAG TPA: PAS domain-containing sensor histidine kinase [Acidimicrobiales bacterium]|nr:PAS domain-containing sensor histidine kinase [Acidimicrobiales bacterium]